ncbi:hypothetical protein WJX77_010882 [Trebouxia sp. C0004]
MRGKLMGPTVELRIPGGVTLQSMGTGPATCRHACPRLGYRLSLRNTFLTATPAFRQAARSTLVQKCRRSLHSGSLVQAEANRSNGSSNGDRASYDFDLFTIGAGSGGVRASRFAAQNYGAKVAVCEMPFDLVASDSKGGAGGTCVLRGCVPKKLMVYGGEFAQAFKDSKGFGWDVPEPSVTWERLMQNKNNELDRLNGVYMKLLNNAGVKYIEGRGTLVDAHTVEVDGKQYTAKTILIATGGRAVKLPIDGAEHAIISDEILNLPSLPKKLAVIGGGYIGLEFAGIYNNYGSEVHVVYRQPLPLRGFDEECRGFIAEQYEVTGLNIHSQSTPTRIEKQSDGSLTLHVKKKDGQEEAIEGLEAILMATGRSPNTQNMNLEKVGIELGPKGQIKVDGFNQTSVPSIYAVGDVTDRVNLTPVALMEGMAFAKNVFGGDPEAQAEYDAIASAVFSNPPLASVGLSEEQATEEYGDVDVFTSSFKPMKNTISGNEARGFMKILVDAKTDTVIGVHMIGPDCAEIMQGFAVAVKMGVKKKQLDRVVGIHPSSAEEFVTMRSPTKEVRDKQPVGSSA